MSWAMGGHDEKEQTLNQLLVELDGFDSGKGLVLWAGDRGAPVVGRVSMDLITVDVTDLPDVPDRLEVLNARQGVHDLARLAGTIGYEILTSLGTRYARRYDSAGL